MTRVRHIWFIALKDLKLFATDRMALSFSLLFPFFFVILFNFVLADIGREDSRLELHLVTQEAEGGMSHQIIGAMETKDESQLQPGEPKIVWDKDYNEALRAVEDKKLAGFVAFPEDFTNGVQLGYGTELEVVVNPEATNTRAALNGLAQAIASRVGAQQVAAGATIGLLVEQALATSGEIPDIGEAMQQFYSGQEGMAVQESLVEFDVEKVGEVEQENPNNYIVSGYLVMFVFFTAALSAENIVRERRNNTLERLLASSVKRGSILGGMFAGTATKGLIQIAVLLAVGILVFKMDLGQSPLAIAVLAVLMVITSAAFGIMLATIARTERSAGAMAVLTSLSFAPLGGCWWPLFIMPKWMQSIAKITPHAWANTGFNKLMVYGADFNAVVPEMLALVIFAAVFGIIAVWRFRTSAV